MVLIRNCSVLLVIVFIKMTLASDIQITFTSSPNTPDIAEGDTAVYNCSSNHSSVGIIWYFNGTVHAESLASLGVTITGPGSTVSSLSVPGLVHPFNNTYVSCFASGPVAGYVSSSPVPLRVQGPPGAVVDISVNFSYISWTAPFTLSGFPILQYNINITNGTAVIYKTNVTVTEWSYSPVEFGNHSVSITAVNSVGEGERSTVNQKTDRYTINNITGSMSVPAGNYSRSVFDINENNIVPTSAVFTSTVVIATATSTSSHTSMLSLSGSTSSPSPSQTINGNKTADINAGTVAAIIGSIFIAGNFCVIVSVMALVSYYIKKRKSKVNATAVIRKGTSEYNKKATPRQHDSRLVQLNYIYVEHGANAPMAPPTFDPNPAPYSDDDQQLFADNSRQLYSTLNSNATTIDSEVTDYYSQDSATTTSITTISDDYLPDSEPECITQTKLTHRVLSEHVAPHLINKWREVGLALALTPPQLDDIEENHPGISDVFQMWEDLETRPFNWETLLTILRSSGVNECELADQLERHVSKSD